MHPSNTRSLKVFLCHAHADAARVRELYRRLKRAGVDAWLDKENLLPGSNWDNEIRKAVREADVVIVCLSKQFNQDGYRQKEVRVALDAAMEKRENTIFLIPARLEECENLDSLSKWQWVDLFDEDGFQNLWRALRTRADSIGAELRNSKRNSVNKQNTSSQQTTLDSLENESEFTLLQRPNLADPEIGLSDKRNTSDKDSEPLSAMSDVKVEPKIVTRDLPILEFKKTLFPKLDLGSFMIAISVFGAFLALGSLVVESPPPATSVWDILSNTRMQVIIFLAASALVFFYLRVRKKKR
jgi:hypothetical protein